MMICVNVKNNFFKIKKYYFNTFMRKKTLKNNRLSNLFHSFVHVNCVFICFCVLKIFLINFNILIFLL
jgi:hypothetical protein